MMYGNLVFAEGMDGWMDTTATGIARALGVSGARFFLDEQDIPNTYWFGIAEIDMQ